MTLNQRLRKPRADDDVDLYNAATDLVLNEVIKATFSLPEGCKTPADLGLVPGLTVDEYYHLLRKDRQLRKLALQIS